MTIYDLNRQEMLLVLEDYIEALKDLDFAIRKRNTACSNINKDFANFAIWILKIFSFICIFPIFLVSFFVFGKLSTYIVGDNILTIVLGIVCAVLVSIGCLAIRKKAINLVKEKSAVTKKDYIFLEKCTEEQKECQEKVDHIYREYSMPNSLSSLITTKWIYDYLLENKDATLDSAIKMHQSISTIRFDKGEKEASRSDDRIVNELRRQNEILQQHNDREYIRNTK